MVWLLILLAAAVVILLVVRQTTSSKSNSGQAQNSDEDVLYNVIFSTRWGSPQSPLNAPPNPHTGNMFLAAHNADYSLFHVGEVASKGIRETSMFGTVDTLLQEASSNPNVSDTATAGSLEAPGSANLVLRSSRRFPQLSFSTMIAPSPDWFTGVSSLSLYDETTGKWRDNLTVPLLAYDAGSDRGEQFANEPDYPEATLQPVTIIQDPPLYSPGLADSTRMIPFATLMLQRMQ